MKNKIFLFIIFLVLLLTYVLPADILFAQTIVSINTSDSLISDFDTGPDNFTITIIFNEAVDTTEATKISFDPVISSTLNDSTPSWSSDSTNFYMNYDVEDNNVEIDSIDIYIQYAQTILDTLFDAFSIDTMNPTDTVFITDFSDPVDTGGHLNIEFYKNGTKGSGYFRLYYTENYTSWPGDSFATIIDTITSPYDLSTIETTNYLVRIYWLDDVGNHSPNFAQAGPMQSIDNSNVYVGTFNTYEFGTQIYPYDTIQEGINNTMNSGTINVESITYSDSVIVNKPIFIKGIASSDYNIDGDVTLDAKPITITNAMIDPPHSWYITDNASIQDGIDAASNGDSIKVNNGTYTENIDINKTVNLSSINGRDSTTIAASNTNDHVIKITSDSVAFNGFSVYGAEIPTDYKAGIYLNTVINCLIINNNFGCSFNQRSDYGILMRNSNSNTLKNNNCDYNFYTGICVEYSNHNNIKFNQCYKNLSNGMVVSNSEFNNFENNDIYDNTVFGVNLYASNNNTVLNNNINLNGMFGISLVNCADNFIDYNFLENNFSAGLRMVNNCTNNIVNNNFSDSNEFGLHISVNSLNNTITNNIFSNNTEHGIVLDNSDNNILTKNLFDSNTTFGLNILSSDNNKIYMNTFSNNSFPVNSTSSINDWNSPTEISYKFNDYSYHKQFLGNFYGSYSGVDSNEDGIGDSPCYLPGSEPNDNYPLILSSDNYIMQAWWLSADSIMYKDSLGNPLHEDTIFGNNSKMWISDQRVNNGINFSTNDTWTGQILFTSPLQLGNTFSFEIGYSISGEDFVFCGPDTTIVGDGSTMLFTYKTDGSYYTMLAGSFYALQVNNNNAGTNYNIVTGGGSTYISGPDFGPELYHNPSDSLNFGKVDTTSITDSTLSIIVKNIGNAELIIDSLLGLEQPFSVNFPAPDTIQIGDSIFIPIILEREFDVGMYIDTLEIFDNCNNSSIIITAQLTEPIISIIPDIIDFGTQAISNEEDSLSFVIKNFGSSKLIVDGFSELEFPFHINYQLPDTIYPEINDSSEIFITFDRSTPGYFIDTLWIHNNDVDTSIVVIGELTEPIISVTPDAIDFGTKSATAQFDSLSFVVKNCGTGDLVIDGLTGLSTPFSLNYTIPDTIQPSDSSEIFIILDMSIPGSHIDTLLIYNNDKDTSLVVTVELTAPIIYLNPDSINFGSMSSADEYDSLSFVIKNIGTEDLTVDGIYGLLSPFSINYTTPDTIQPQDSSLIFIKLDQSVAGSYCDTLFIYNDDQDTSLVITADLIAPFISIIPDSINFGEKIISNEYDSLSFVVKNIGTEDLTVDGIDGLLSPFSINYTTPDTIQPQDSSLIFIKLDQSVAGSYCDTLYIYNNHNDTSLIVTANIIAPFISVTPEDTLHFGAMNTTDLIDSTKIILVKNVGTADLIISNLQGFSFPFSFNYNYPDTILPGDSTEISVILDRNVMPGLYCDTLLIYNNDVDTSIVVIGELTEPIISITPEAIDFGTKLTTTQYDSLSFVIKNSGTGDLVIDALNGLSSPFSINYSVPDSIQPSDSSEIFIILDMSVPGLHIDTLLIYNNDHDTSLVVTAEITAPFITVIPDSIDFGIMEKSISYDSLSFVVKNLGDGNLIIDGFDGLSEPFNVNHPLPDTINPIASDSSEIYVKLNKNISGLFCDTLFIYSNDHDTSLIVTAEIKEPLIAIIPDTIDFGILEMCSEIDSLPFVIKNLGNGDLIVSNVAGLSSPFNIDYSTPDTIYPINDSSQIFVKIDKNNTPGLYCDTLWIYNNANDTSLVIIANIANPPEPKIISIKDVPYDQGRQIQLLWQKSSLDSLGSPQPIIFYSVWRYDEIFKRSGQNIYQNPYEILEQVSIDEGKTSKILNMENSVTTAREFLKKNYTYYWQRGDEILTFITQLPAMGFDEYSVIATTLLDSCSTSFNYTSFKVFAHTEIPLVYFGSEPDSGYSVDNIPPNSVGKINMIFTGAKKQNSLILSWPEVKYGTYNGNLYPELNGIWYKVYGSENYNFECNDSTNKMITTQDTTFSYEIINKEKMFFKIITSDQPIYQK